MPVYRLPDDDYNLFPHPSEAESNGLIAISHDLQEQRLIGAYANGLFPWFEEDGYFYWYTPDPRWVLKPADLRIHKSMRSVFNQHKFRYTFDTAFEQVMQACAQTVRQGGESGKVIFQPPRIAPVPLRLAHRARGLQPETGAIGSVDPTLQLEPSVGHASGFLSGNPRRLAHRLVPAARQ